MQLIRLLTTFTTVMLGVHLLSSCSGKRSSKSSSSGGASSGTSEIEVSGSISDEEPLDFVQSSQSVAISGVNLTSATSYLVTAYSLEHGGLKKLIFEGSFAEPKFSFKSSVARQYIVIAITRLPDGGQFGAVLPPPTSNKKAALIVDGATTIAAKMASLIASKAASGDQGAREVLSIGSVSVADLLMVSQSVRTTVMEQKVQGKGSAIDLSSLTANLISKSNERIAKLNAEGQSSKAVAEKLSESSYQTIFGDDAKVAPAGVLAYRVNPDLGSSEAAKTTVAYEAIKASVSDSTKVVDEAFRAEATAYRTATSTAAAVAAKTTVTSAFKEAFTSCMSSPSSCAQASYTPPQSPSLTLISPPPCTADGMVGCVTTETYKSANLTNLTPENIKKDVTVAGVAGNVIPSPAACTENGIEGCVTTSTYKSADLANLSAGNIKSTVTIAGVTGNYPSATSPLVGADATADLSDDQATRESQLRSATNFEFFMSDGTRVVAAGDPDIAASNIKDQVNIFGITGDVTSPNAWDLRAGVTVGSVTGKLKVNCRNRANGDVSGDSVVDIWDTIDDYLGVPPTNVWGNNTDCGGVEAAAGDDNVWKDVTTTSAGAASNCATDGTRCTMQDKITGLWWSKLQANATWNEAWSNCQSLNHNGQTGWRLPTQKELMEAYTHGIRSAASANWMTEAHMTNYFWSGSSVSDDTSLAWIVSLAYGHTATNLKDDSDQVVCVR